MEPDPPPDASIYRDEDVAARAEVLLQAASTAAGRPPIRALCEHVTDDAHACIAHPDGLRCKPCFAGHLTVVDHDIVTVCECCGLDTLEAGEISWVLTVAGVPVFHLDGSRRRFAGVITLWSTTVCPHCEDTIYRAALEPQA